MTFTISYTCLHTISEVTLEWGCQIRNCPSLMEVYNLHSSWTPARNIWTWCTLPWKKSTAHLVVADKHNSVWSKLRGNTQSLWILVDPSGRNYLWEGRLHEELLRMTLAKELYGSCDVGFLWSINLLMSLTFSSLHKAPAFFITLNNNWKVNFYFPDFLQRFNYSSSWCYRESESVL